MCKGTWICPSCCREIAIPLFVGGVAKFPTHDCGGGRTKVWTPGAGDGRFLEIEKKVRGPSYPHKGNSGTGTDIDVLG